MRYLNWTSGFQTVGRVSFPMRGASLYQGKAPRIDKISQEAFLLKPNDQFFPLSYYYYYYCCCCKGKGLPVHAMDEYRVDEEYILSFLTS
jgi:hypothetical protein